MKANLIDLSDLVFYYYSRRFTFIDTHVFWSEILRKSLGRQRPGSGSEYDGGWRETEEGQDGDSPLCPVMVSHDTQPQCSLL